VSGISRIRFAQVADIFPGPDLDDAMGMDQSKANVEQI